MFYVRTVDIFITFFASYFGIMLAGHGASETFYMADAKEILAIENPLGVDEQTVREFNIPAEADPSPVRKLAFLQAQLEELESQAWRERVNIVHAVRLQQSPVEALRMKGNNNIMEHKNTVKQFTDGMVMIKRMIEQLREKYEELRVEE